MAENEYYDFEKALKKLSLEEEDLKRLISAGEIRAFRDGTHIRLRAEDVERVAKDLGVTAGKGSEGEVLEVEEVLFSESAPDDKGMITTQLTEQDTLLDEDLEVVEVEEERPAAGAAAAPRGARAVVVEKENRSALLLQILTAVLLVYGLSFLFAAGDARSNGMTDPVVKLVSK